MSEKNNEKKAKEETILLRKGINKKIKGKLFMQI